MEQPAHKIAARNIFERLKEAFGNGTIVQQHSDFTTMKFGFGRFFNRYEEKQVAAKLRLAFHGTAAPEEPAQWGGEYEYTPANRTLTLTIGQANEISRRAAERRKLGKPHDVKIITPQAPEEKARLGRRL